MGRLLQQAQEVVAVPALAQRLRALPEPLVVDEAHAQHFIGFVQHQHFHLIQQQRAAVHQIEQAARGGDEDVGPAMQLVAVLADRGAADNRLHLQSGERAIVLGRLGDLPAAASAYQTGRLFVQAPHRREWDALCTDYAGGSAALERRRRTELQVDEPCAWGAWGVYTQPEQMEQLIAWLRPRGIREQALKAQLLKYRDAIESGMRRRIDDIALGVREPVVETRRSTRMRSEQATQLRMPYMQWRNTART